MRWARLAILSLTIAALAGCGKSSDPTAQLLAEVRRNPDSVDARVQLGDAYMDSEAHHDAYIQYLAAYDRDSESFAASLGLARAQEALADIEGAQKHIAEALAIKPDDPDALALNGRMLLRTNQPQEAAIALKKARDLAPDNEIAHTYLPIAYVSIGEFGKAEEAARAALEQVPQSIDVHLNLALVLLARDKGDEAESVLRAAMEVDPGNPAPPLRLAELLIKEHRDLSEAVLLADLSADLDAGGGEPDAVAALALRELGREEDAIRRLHTAAMANPRNVRLWMMLASAYRSIGEDEAAARAASMAFRFAPRKRVRTAPPGDETGSGASTGAAAAEEPAAEATPSTTGDEPATAPSAP